MRKRIISSLLILTLLITGIMLGKAPVAYASGNSETGRSSEQHDSINAAKLIVATFVAEDIKTMLNQDGIKIVMYLAMQLSYMI